MLNKKIAVLGTGAWGTALANVLLDNKNAVTMWGIDQKEIADLKKQMNNRYFGEKKLAGKPVLITDQLKTALVDAQYVLLAIPSKFLEAILEQLKVILKNRKVVIINVAKGISLTTKKFWSQVIKENFANNLVALVSLLGPSFASEVFDKELTVINAVGSNEKIVDDVVKLFTTKYFKLIPNTDEIGADLFAALKNVAAIGTGIVYQLHQSMNTRSAIVACVFKEIAEIYQKLTNHQSLPLIGFELCGIGDLVLTCTSEKSRNFRFGNQVAMFGVDKALNINDTTVEGYLSAQVIHDILKSKQISAPIIQWVYDVLYKNKDPQAFADIIGEKTQKGNFHSYQS